MGEVLFITALSVGAIIIMGFVAYIALLGKGMSQ